MCVLVCVCARVCVHACVHVCVHITLSAALCFSYTTTPCSVISFGKIIMVDVISIVIFF